jgi:hypothetical protein
MNVVQLELEFKDWPVERPPYKPTGCYFKRMNTKCPFVVGKPGQTIFITCNKCKYQ